MSAFLVLMLGACSEKPILAGPIGIGPSPTLPPPRHAWMPTVHVAKAEGWSSEATPTAAQGMHVAAFASGLNHPRWLHVLSNGDVLVAETNAPAKADGAKGMRVWIMGMLMKRAGAGGTSADRITLLRDTDGDGRADQRWVLLDKLKSPLGMAQVGDELFVANTDAIMRFPLAPAHTYITAKGVELVSLPAGSINHHWTKNIIPNADSTKLYVTVGSNSNVGERGIEAEAGRAAIWEVDIASGTHRLFATGLRNPNGLAWIEETSTLWTVVNERDELGDDLVPDYLTSVKAGAFYGWPYSYFGANVDERVQPRRSDLVATAIAPDYALGAHTASLGLASSAGTSLPAFFAHGMFVGQHGSWNRRPFSGYKVIFVPFRNGRPSGALPVDVLTGFLSESGKAYGRPVGVALDKHGALLVADDVGNTIWRVTSLK